MDIYGWLHVMTTANEVIKVSRFIHDTVYTIHFFRFANITVKVALRRKNRLSQFWLYLEVYILAWSIFHLVPKKTYKWEYLIIIIGISYWNFAAMLTVYANVCIPMCTVFVWCIPHLGTFICYVGRWRHKASHLHVTKNLNISGTWDINLVRTR